VEERRGPADNDVIKRWLGSGFTVADIKRHTQHDMLREAFTKRQQDSGVTSPTAQVHLAQIQAATPRPVGGDFQAFTDQLKKVADIGKALDAGTDFAEVAKQYSEDSATKDNGGDIGWIARGMLTDLSAENELFNIPAGQRSQQHNGLTMTTWYKVIEKSDSRDLEDAQKKTISDNAYTYWLNGQKKAHNVLRLIPGLEFE
jgi:PPIC-type PPIASE domain